MGALLRTDVEFLFRQRAHNQRSWITIEKIYLMYTLRVVFLFLRAADILLVSITECLVLRFVMLE